MGFHGLRPCRRMRCASSRNGRAQAAENAARQELPEGLAEARRRRVLRCGHPNVVTAVVLDVEVAVAGLRQGDLGQPALQRILLVAHLVRGVDADAAEHTDRQRDAELADPAQRAVKAEPTQVRGGEQVGAQDHAEVLERDVDVGAVAVVLVVLQPLHHLVGRVLPVGPEEQVEHGQQDVEQDRPDPQRHLRGGMPAEMVQAPDDRQHHEQRRRGDQSHEPQVALLVAPFRRFGATSGPI